MNIDINKPIENPKLKSLLKEYKESDDEKRIDIQENILEEFAMNAKMLIVVKLNENDLKRDEDNKVTFKKDTTISFIMFKNKKGDDYLPIYTDWNEIRKNKDYQNMHIDTFVLTFDDITQIVLNKAGIVINPFSDNFIIPLNNVIHMKQHKDSILKGYTENIIEKEEVVQIGDPLDYPTSMVEDIKEYAKTNKDIKNMWLKLMMREKEKSYLLIIDHDGNKDMIFKEITNILKPFNELPIDMISYEDDFGKKAADDKPFYKKEL